MNSSLVLLSFIAVLWWAFSHSHQDALNINALITTLIIPIIGLFIWSYFLVPFTPQYGAWKYLYIGVAVAAPLAVIIVGAIPQSKSPGFTRVMPVAIVLLIAMYSPPWNNIRWVDSVQISSGYVWADHIVNEIRENPNRAVGCLNTSKGDTEMNYIGYLCSRMSFGLGGFDEYVHRTWTAANICQIPPTQAKNAFRSQFQKSLTVLLFDGSRTTSFAECQAPTEDAPNGWLSSIDWSVVRKLDPNGKVLEIPATQPNEE